MNARPSTRRADLIGMRPQSGLTFHAIGPIVLANGVPRVWAATHMASMDRVNQQPRTRAERPAVPPVRQAPPEGAQQMPRRRAAPAAEHLLSAHGIMKSFGK